MDNNNNNKRNETQKTGKNSPSAKAATSSEGTPSKISIDPFEVRIQEEVEEFLRDLTLEYPFPEIFETLRRCEYRDRYGAKVLPFPKRSKPFVAARVKDIDGRIRIFLTQLKSEFGVNYTHAIDDSFKFYTQTTVD